jgi:hypothetical protein
VGRASNSGNPEILRILLQILRRKQVGCASNSGNPEILRILLKERLKI